MKIRFLKPAQSEVDDAVVWYDSQSFGLGTQFLDDLDRVVRRIGVIHCHVRRSSLISGAACFQDFHMDLFMVLMPIQL